MVHARKDYDRIQDPDNKIAEDEPVFLLVGRDVSAGTAVRAWARANDRNGGDPELSALALEHAKKMDAWAKKHGKPADGVE